MKLLRSRRTAYTDHLTPPDLLGRADPKHHESDTHVRRGRITKQGSRLVRWAAVESVKTSSATTPAGVLRERVADRRGRNIGSVAAARRQLEFVFYALRDGHVRALEHRPWVA